MEDTSATPGQRITLVARLATADATVAATQNDLTYDPTVLTVVRKSNGRPDCSLDSDLDKNGTSFVFRPNGCNPAGPTFCTSIRAIVVATDNTDPIPDDSILYTCHVDIANLAPAGPATLTNSGVVLSDPLGAKVDGASGREGEICIGQPG